MTKTIKLNQVTLKGGTATAITEDLEDKIPEGYIAIGGFVCSVPDECAIVSTYAYKHAYTGRFTMYARVRNWNIGNLNSTPQALCFFMKK